MPWPPSRPRWPAWTWPWQARINRREYLLHTDDAGSAATGSGKPSSARICSGDTVTPPAGVVVAWSEGTEPRRVYPQGIAQALAAGWLGLAARGQLPLPDRPVPPDRPALPTALPSMFRLVTTGLPLRHQGLEPELLETAQVLVWWGHRRHDAIAPATVGHIVELVESGRLGFVALHSAHLSRPWRALLRTSGRLGGARLRRGPELLTITDPHHPITRGLASFHLPWAEAYREPFDVPAPAAVLLRSTYRDGSTFPSGCTWQVGAGRVFYFAPGHETYPVFHESSVLLLLWRAVLWAGGWL